MMKRYGIIFFAGWMAMTGCAAGGGDAAKKFNADLPDLLTFQDGRKVGTAAEWPARNTELRQLMMETFTGTLPQEIPGIVKAEVLQQRQEADGSVRREVQVTLGTPHQAALKMWVWQPKGEGPFPVLLTAPRFYQIGWANEALKRGYIVCLYPGLDSHHEEKDYPGYQSLWEGIQKEYPQAGWREIVVKAWLASRCVDYLLDPRFGYPVAKDQIGIIGFSRYGKQALAAAGYDPRITAVIARSSGACGSAPYHFNGREIFGEACCDFAKPWFLESLRDYFGRENEMPIDSHGWLGLIAPRHCMLDTAYNDDGDPTFAAERAYLQGRQVYRLLGHPERLCLSYRSGGHETKPIPDQILPERYRQNLDWFDLAFKRGVAAQSEFPEMLIHHFDWQAWRGQQRPQDVVLADNTGKNTDEKAKIRQQIQWMLGEKPEKLEGRDSVRFLTDEEDWQMGHDNFGVKGTTRLRVSFGAGVAGNVYYNPEVKEPAPAVIFLHPFSYGPGYAMGYGIVGDVTIYHGLAKAGYVVLAYDQCGFGLRLLEGRDFYEKSPHWSRLGRLIEDVRGAVDFLAEGKGQAQGSMPAVRKDQVYVLGYALGGMVGLYAAARDERIAGVASFCGFTPLRTDTDAKITGGIKRWWQWHALLPKLGLFAGREAEISYDYEDVLSLIAPRPCLIVSPTQDRHADNGDIVRCMQAAQKTWQTAGKAGQLTHLCPDDVNRFEAEQRKIFLNWFQKVTQDKQGGVSKSPAGGAISAP
jgi:pimeloyl-ACP methyl ester carboxylesterase